MKTKVEKYLESIFNNHPELLEMEYIQYGYDFRNDELFLNNEIKLKDIEVYMDKIGYIENKDYEIYLDRLKNYPNGDIVDFIEINNLKYWKDKFLKVTE